MNDPDDAAKTMLGAPPVHGDEAGADRTIAQVQALPSSLPPELLQKLRESRTGPAQRRKRGRKAGGTSAARALGVSVVVTVSIAAMGAMVWFFLR